MRVKINPKKSVGALFILVAASFLYPGSSVGGTLTHPQTQSQQKELNSMKDGDKKESPFVCNINALNGEQRKRMGDLVNRINAKRKQVKELPDGYAFRFAGEPEMVKDLAEFIVYEKMCCPFFDFELALEREGGPLWLRLKGREGVKAFIKIEFGL